jgi:hypothetical protein
MFTNPARLHLTANPDFFVGTAVEQETAMLRPTQLVDIDRADR